MARIDPGPGEHTPARHTREAAEEARVAARRALALSEGVRSASAPPRRLEGVVWLVAFLVVAAIVAGAIAYTYVVFLGLAP